MAEGAGLGYFGMQGYAVASALPEHVPHVYGFADGLLYRDWLPPGHYRGVSRHPGMTEALAGAVASYVTARREALPGAIGRGGSPGWPGPGLGGRRDGDVRPVRAVGLARPAASA